MLSNTLKKEMLKILKELIGFNTENPPGKTKEIIEYLSSTVFKEQNGFRNKIYEYTNENTALHNFISEIGQGEIKIIFCGHFDTVPIGDIQRWKFPPFSAKIDNGNIYGRGSADMKGGIVSIIGIIKYLMEKHSFLNKFKLVFIGTADEEAGMSGSKLLSEKDIINDGNLLIITEPTNLEIGVAEKGVLWSRIIIKGKAAHGSMPRKGINAIENAAKIIPKLQFCVQEKTNPILGISTLNIGKIEGGSAINVVPEKVELDLDFRLIPEQDPRVVIQNLNNLDPSPCSMEITTPVQLPALKTDLDNKFIENLKKLINKEFIGLSYATDAAYLVDPKNPIPFVLFGPGDPERIHKVNEYVPLPQVYDCSEYLLKSLIKTFIK